MPLNANRFSCRLELNFWNPGLVSNSIPNTFNANFLWRFHEYTIYIFGTVASRFKDFDNKTKKNCFDANLVRLNTQQ